MPGVITYSLLLPDVLSVALLQRSCSLVAVQLMLVLERKQGSRRGQQGHLAQALFGFISSLRDSLWDQHGERSLCFGEPLPSLRRVLWRCLLFPSRATSGHCHFYSWLHFEKLLS